MKKLLFFSLALFVFHISRAQVSPADELCVSLNRDVRIDNLLERKNELTLANKSTKDVNLQLAWNGVKYPASIIVTRINGRTNISFELLEDGNSGMIAARITRVKKKISGLEYLGVDPSNNYCSAIFIDSPTSRQIEKLVGEFLYDGYYIAKAPQAEFGSIDK